MSRVALALGVALVLGAAPLPAAAQPFPARAVTLIIPTAPGGSLDVLGRLVQPKMTELLGVPFVVENKPGASTYLAGEYVARSAPDGYTLLFNTTSGLFPDIFTKGLAVQLSNELTPIALIGRGYFLFYGPPSVPARDLREFMSLLKANPDKYNLGSLAGGLPSIQTLIFLDQQNVKMLAVPFNSTTDITTAMLRGDVHLYAGSGAGVKAMVDAGKLRVFATAGDKRAPGFSDVPTTAELGLGKVNISGEYAVIAPARTSAAIVRALNDRFRQVVAMPEIRAALEKFGFDADPMTPDALARDWEQLKASVPGMVKQAGVTPR